MKHFGIALSLLSASLLMTPGWSQEPPVLPSAANPSRPDGTQSKPTLSRRELRILIQKQQDEMLGILLVQDAPELSGNASFLADLELDVDQHRDLGNAISKRRQQTRQLVEELKKEASQAKSPEEIADVQDRAYRKIAQLADEALQEFRGTLLPHQLEKLDQLLAQVRLQSALQICQLYEVSWGEVCAAFFDLDPQQEKRFLSSLEEASNGYRQNIADAKRQLRDQMLKAVPESQRAEWGKMIGDDPSMLIEMLRVLGHQAPD